MEGINVKVRQVSWREDRYRMISLTCGIEIKLENTVSLATDYETQMTAQMGQEGRKRGTRNNKRTLGT